MYSELIGNNKNIGIKSLIDNIMNSGEWQNDKTAIPENQRKCALPMNDITTTIFYNQRIIISAPIKEPIAWHCSKVEQTAPKGTNRLTFAQKQWDEHKDAFEYSDGTYSHILLPEKKVVGMWADYYATNVEPIDNNIIVIPNKIHSEITFSGVKSEIKVNGNYKKFTITYYDSNNEIMTNYRIDSSLWYFQIYNPKTNTYLSDSEVDELVSILDSSEAKELKNNQIKIKLTNAEDYIGQVFVIGYADAQADTFIEMDIVSL